jgi:homoserine kinase type II
MAVYTEIADAELEAFLTRYDLGAILALKGIAEGVENSNYLLQTQAGFFILTLYEKRVDSRDLPFFLSLLEHLASRDINCPQPVRTKAGEALGTLAGRPAAIVTFLEGLSAKLPNVAQCGALGAALAKLHAAGADFTLSRQNALALQAWPSLYQLAEARAGEVRPGLAASLAEELQFLGRNWPDHLPKGVIHADLFPDNVLFLGERVSGLIDFYFACTDMLAYDLAISMNAWCFAPDFSYDLAKGQALFKAYEKIRPLNRDEIAALPILARGASLRFALTRLVDWLNVPKGALVHPKDPLEYLAKLEFHRKVTSAEELGVKG